MQVATLEPEVVDAETVTHKELDPILKAGVVATSAFDPKPKFEPVNVNTTLPWVGAEDGLIEVMDGGKKENDCVEVLHKPGQ